MEDLYCVNCEENVTISDISNPECPNCWGDDFKEAAPTDTTVKGAVKSIELIYQSNFEKIALDFLNPIQILGRGFEGSELLSEIKVNNRPVISKRHCQIEFRSNENSFYVLDLNSTNGTFVNGKKAVSEILLEDQNIIKLGREVFVASFVYEEIQDNSDNTEVEVMLNNSDTENIESGFYCPDCSTNYQNDGYCSECDVKLRKN
ncbi:FHA domain-containing protein [Polaribacter sp. R77954]|uniref:FHA domain-containing protein n=1 Tax=Polaribacter sp. R77954 TaxID=3093870 RepID=UPI0037C5EBB8